MKEKMEGFLQGYRVLDLTDERGHLCGRILGDMGADVIKIEPPGGDPARNRGPFYHDEPHPEKGLYWFFANANKRGITLNLKTIDGREIFRQLVKGADVIIESFRPAYIEELGLDYPSLTRIKPDIILSSITPFGQDGPYAHYRVTDLVAASMGGMVYVHGDEDRAPVRISVPQAYFLGSQHAAMGTLTALYDRELTGEGQMVDTSIQEAIVYTLTYHLQAWEQRQAKRVRGGPFFNRPRPLPLGPLKARQIFRCRDGLVALSFQGGVRTGVKSSRQLVAWANKEGYALKIRDFDWETWDSSTMEQSDQDLLDEEISRFLLTKTKYELLQGAAKRRILLAPLSTAADLPQNPQLAFRNFWVEVFHPELNDTLTYPGPFVKVDQCLQQIHVSAPGIGEHNREIYGGELGLSIEKRSLLKGQGVI